MSIIKQARQATAVFAAVLFLATGVFAEDDGRVSDVPDTYLAVASDDAQADATISKNPSQAKYFLLFSEKGELVKSIANPASGKLAEIAQDLAQQETTALIAANFTQKEQDALAAKDIMSVVKTGSAVQAIRDLLQCEPDSPAAKAEKAAAKQ